MLLSCLFVNCCLLERSALLLNYSYKYYEHSYSYPISLCLLSFVEGRKKKLDFYVITSDGLDSFEAHNSELGFQSIKNFMQIIFTK